MSSAIASGKTPHEFHITVLGRTLEHLGVQMYKRRDVAVAELVANCWDAGAKNVWIEIPRPGDYNQAFSKIIITDDGDGMTVDQIQNEYLVVGRNRREDSKQGRPQDPTKIIAGRAEEVGQAGVDEEGVIELRPIMGRKGIGKLAGFGLAKRLHVMTWKTGEAVEFNMDIEPLKVKSGKAQDIPIPGLIGEVPPSATTPTGTKVTLFDLKHSTHIDLDKLRESLARRFSRRVRGRMSIFVNKELLGEPQLDLEFQNPPPKVKPDMRSEKLEDDTKVRYRYAFSKGTISSAEMRGFTIYVRGKTAQAPPFYFQVEGTASGQHATKYLTGEIEADFLDAGTDDESDIISTDRQEIDWESEKVEPLKKWGEQLTRKLFREWADRNGDRMESWILNDNELSARISKLDPASQKQVKAFLRRLGNVEAVKDRALELASSLIRAYEYRHFIDVVEQIENISDDPEALQTLLIHLNEWSVLESRAILEIIKGRLNIIEKFHSMIVNNAPETKSSKSLDNMHDLLAGQPWLLNPEWQVLYEEKSVTRQLKEWGYADTKDVEETGRFDFLALKGDGRLVVIEIKRSDYPVSFAELARLEDYRNRLTKAHTENMHMVLIYGGVLDVPAETRKNWEQREDGELREWKDVYSTTRDYYEHYRAVLEGNISHEDFQRKTAEVVQTRSVLAIGTVHRDSAARQKGLGPQDSNYITAAPSSVQVEDERNKTRVVKLIKKSER